VSLGLARFSYALLLPPMRSDLGWSYLTAGAMNTVNAAGYLLGALALPAHPRAGSTCAGVLLAAAVAARSCSACTAVVTGDAALFALRLLTGIASAAAFVAGGVLAARLASGPAPGSAPERGPRRPDSSSASTTAAPASASSSRRCSSSRSRPVVSHRLAGRLDRARRRRAAGDAGDARADRHLAASPAASATPLRFRWAPFAPGLAGYFLFGLGYIGYMTFVITLLREQRMGRPRSPASTSCSARRDRVVVAVGRAAAAQPRRCGIRPAERAARGRDRIAVMSPHPLAVFASGALFGSVFLSVVASTTAWVRHNLPPAAWAGGIGAFTIVFAAGQIVGPSLVGWVADGAGGLVRGFVVSAAVLAGAALIGGRQKPLAAA
jgi:hypothetical protein